MTTRSLFLLLLLDAFRPDYMRHTPFIRQLAQQGVVGRLREPFGFTPREAYFGGLTSSESGFTNMLWLDPEQSPFAIARLVYGQGVRSSHRSIQQARSFIEQHARTHVSPYVSSYLTTLDIPIQYLPLFAYTETEAPWSPRITYRSLFTLMNERGVPWFQCAWPMSNMLHEKGDGGIVAQTLRELRGNPRFGYVHLSALDSGGHQYGPHSAEMIALLSQLDDHVRAIVEAAYLHYDTVDLVMFGDHGMVPVIGAIDVWSALRQLPIELEYDYMCFLDSTMARFWFSSDSARVLVTGMLERLAGGRILDAHDMQRYEIDRCDPRNGELYYLLDPGYVIAPNFFNMRGEIPHGMHGYDPDAFDNLGVFIANTQSRHIRGHVGTIDARQILHTCLDLLNIDDALRNLNLSALSKPRIDHDSSQYIVDATSEDDKVITAHLQTICSEIQQMTSDLLAIVLIGGFGRGEGSVSREHGGIRPINDYDLLVVSRTADPEQLKHLGVRLAQELEIDFVDIGILHPDYLGQLHLTMLTFDLKYGSRVIWGDPTILRQVPSYASADLPLKEGVQLLFNRIAGLLLGFDRLALEGHPLEQRRRELMTNQIVKALLAIGDWYLIAWRTYDASYQVRLSRWQALCQHAQLSDAECELIRSAYIFKLHPMYQQDTDLISWFQQVLRPLKHALCHALATSLSVAGYATESDPLSYLLRAYMSEQTQQDAKEIGQLRATLAWVLFSTQSHGAAHEDYLAHAAALLHGKRLVSSEHISQFETFREAALMRWEELCH